MKIKLKEGESFAIQNNEGDVIFKKPDVNLVDLGLPSGTLWADRNVGATEVGNYGLFFLHGDTKGVTLEQAAYISIAEAGGKAFDNSYASGFANIPPNKYNLTDAANAYYGGDWRIPSTKDFLELYSNCNKTTDSFGNVTFTSKINGNSVQFPSETVSQYNYPGVGFAQYWTTSNSYKDSSGTSVSTKSENTMIAFPAGTDFSEETDFGHFYLIRSVCGGKKRISALNPNISDLNGKILWICADDVIQGNYGFINHGLLFQCVISGNNITFGVLKGPGGYPLFYDGHDFSQYYGPAAENEGIPAADDMIRQVYNGFDGYNVTYGAADTYRHNVLDVGTPIHIDPEYPNPNKYLIER